MPTVTEQFTISVSVAQPLSGLTATYVVPSGLRQGTYVYSEDGGNGQTVTQLDRYIDPDGDFTMSCVAVRRSDAPLQVIFRRVPGWSCVIFECCDALASTNQHMMPSRGDLNTVTITEGGTTLGTVRFWGQWGLGRWRWQSGVWPFPKDAAKLRAKGWLPKMDPLALGTMPGLPPWTPYTPMHIPQGFPLYVGSGGDPTLFTSVQGYWLCNPSPASLAHMLEQAEGLAAYPWFIRDCTTWGVPDIWHKYPTKTTWTPAPAGSTLSLSFVGTPGTKLGNCTVTDELAQRWSLTWQPYANIDATGRLTNYGVVGTNVYPGSTEPSGPFVINAPPGTVTAITKVAGSFVQGSGLTIDEAHSGSMWALPWLATGDPYYLEALHAKYAMIWQGGSRAVPRAKLSYSQIRMTAWQLTSLMLSAATTPDVTPSWLLPKSLWQWLWADEKRLWQSELVNGTTPGSKVFHTVGITAGGGQGGPWLATWQEDMILQVTSWAAMLMPDCKFMAEWKAADQIARTNGTSGWCPFFPEGYYLNFGPANGTWYQSWAEAWAANQVSKTVPTPTPTVLASSADYCGQLRAGMAFATQAGVAGVAAPLATLTGRMKAGGTKSDQWNRMFAAVPVP